MDDDRYTHGQDPRRREALLVLVASFLCGLLLIATVARLIHIGPTLGNILFSALPLLAAVAAAARLRHDPSGSDN